MLSTLKKWKVERFVRRLKARGLKLGKDVYLNDGFFLDSAHCELITIRDKVVFGPSVTVLAHDASTRKLVNKTRVQPVVIGENCFIGARAIILPGVVIGANSIVGAGSVVTKSIPENEIWAGVPAKFIATRDSLLSRLETESYPTISHDSLTSDPVKLAEFTMQVFKSGGGWIEG